MYTPIHLTLLALGAPLVLGSQDQAGPPVFSVSELSIQTYQPEHVPSYDLIDIVGGMVGRTFFLEERGGILGDSIDNMSLLGDSLLFYDTSEDVLRMLETVKAVDLPSEAADDEPEEPLVTFHYTPRYLSMEDTFSVAEQLTGNLSVAEGRRILMVYDEPGVVAELEMLLKQVDVPEDQILVTAYLVRGWQSDEGGPALPADLTEHLGRLVPGVELQGAGFAMLQSSVQPRSDWNVHLQLTGAGSHEEFYLSFTPTVYDRQTGSLTVQGCELTQQKTSGPHKVFSTNTVFRGGEYTVLGATGAKPIFVVVRLTKV
jgi:hypothetical protein